MSVVIKWRNRWSGEEGYVESIAVKTGNFVNTYDINKAHKYTQKNTVTNALNTLAKIGETAQNDFYIVEL